jgi:peptidoglycan/LPS O-acetylase OafA/YrhL
MAQITALEQAGLLSESTISARWQSIDALRGIAALAVVFFHLLKQTPADKGAVTPLLADGLRSVTEYGFVGVFLFFVISGFCIHLRWAKATAAGREPDMAFLPFWKRRWRRLYPPYLIVLAIFTLWTAWRGDLRVNGFFFYDSVMHLLMLHNLDKDTVYSINGVFWTLAIEEQLYLAYFLLLSARKRFGWAWALVMCAAARVGWYVFGNFWSYKLLGWHVPVNESALTHWFTWALGALAVEWALGLVALPKWCRNFNLGGLLLLGAVAMENILPWSEKLAFPAHDALWLIGQPLWGLAFFCLLNHFVHAETAWQECGREPRWVGVLAAVGLFSYSLYLTHELVLMQMYRFWIFNQSWLFVALVIMLPLSLAAAWVFFWLCERPFLNPPK